ncbi:dethiobiotin synthase [Mucilaginibacter sp. dw_454]|uniref:dethiobiotin synthase n=1 Tax=Mucilaginibacter sp. dw_454 TaxID=2720079 RepID=UPI001BD55297|nr:dethiobiotin synthase [Mucilaginibacter sp. dw_454]
MNKPLFITGVGTGIGKTVVSAILVESLKADYWKPIQSGDLDNSDTLKVQSLVSNTQSIFHPESYRLTQPFSPHKSAVLDGIEIDPTTIKIPQTDNTLIIEGAGGLMVPLNNNFLMIDLIQQLGAEVILVVKHYLGSINHTLLSLEALRNRNIPVIAVIFNGEPNESSEEVIKNYAQCPALSIPDIQDLSKEGIAGVKVKL